MRRVIDCFTFLNELDLLEIRLKYLNSEIDYFVIVESNKTFAGNSKEYNFKNNINRFEKYKNKIIYVPIEASESDTGTISPWIRESFQRNKILKGIQQIGPNKDDMILIGDLDEIPNITTIRSIKNNSINFNTNNNTILNFLKYSLNRLLEIPFRTRRNSVPLKLHYYYIFHRLTPPINFQMESCCYYLNYRKLEGTWSGTQCVNLKWLSLVTPNEIRNFRLTPLVTIRNAGWHFSYLGGTKRVIYKIRNFSHQELNIPGITQDEFLKHCVIKGYDLTDLKPLSDKKKIFTLTSLSNDPHDLYSILKKYDHLILTIE